MTSYATPRSLADELGVHVRVVLSAIARGELVALRLGHRSIRIARADADAWIASRRTTPVAGTGA